MSTQVLDRAVRLIDLIAQADGPVRLKILAADGELHPATAHRLLASLAELGLVAREGDGYRLGPRLAVWGARVPGPDMGAVAQPLLEELRDRVRESVNLLVRAEDEVSYLARAVAEGRSLRVEHVIGTRAPLHVTAGGKLFLAAGGPAALVDYVARTGLPRFTEHSLCDAPTLAAAVEEAGANGYARDVAEAEPGVGCLAVPVTDRAGTMIAALSISAPLERIDDGWLKDLQATAARLAGRLEGRAI
jgi:DNA-binding IclR family transcriptional regulator